MPCEHRDLTIACTAQATCEPTCSLARNCRHVTQHLCRTGIKSRASRNFRAPSRRRVPDHQRQLEHVYTHTQQARLLHWIARATTSARRTRGRHANRPVASQRSRCPQPRHLCLSGSGAGEYLAGCSSCTCSKFDLLACNIANGLVFASSVTVALASQVLCCAHLGVTACSYIGDVETFHNVAALSLFVRDSGHQCQAVQVR